MPHLRLEYSAPSGPTPDLRALFARLHEALSALEVLAVADLKSRALRCDDVCVGLGDGSQAFAHLEIALLAGRDISVRERIGQIALKVLSEHFAAMLADGRGQLSVEVREMDRACYAKWRPEGV